MSEYQLNSAQKGDALALLRSLLVGCTSLVFFDPQYRGVMDMLNFGNEGARQKERFKLPPMTGGYIDACCREAMRLLIPSGYFMLWTDTFNLCEAHHLRIADVCKVVDLLAWDNQRMGMGKRTRRRGDYLLIIQKPPITPSTWRDRGIPELLAGEDRPQDLSPQALPARQTDRPDRTPNQCPHQSGRSRRRSGSRVFHGDARRSRARA